MEGITYTKQLFVAGIKRIVNHLSAGKKTFSMNNYDEILEYKIPFFKHSKTMTNLDSQEEYKTKLIYYTFKLVIDVTG